MIAHGMSAGVQKTPVSRNLFNFNELNGATRAAQRRSPLPHATPQKGVDKLEYLALTYRRTLGRVAGLLFLSPMGAGWLRFSGFGGLEPVAQLWEIWSAKGVAPGVVQSVLVKLNVISVEMCIRSG